MATTIPKQHYVTIQYRADASTDSGLLGFASPYTKDAAFEKRKHTQDSWAYGYGCTVKIDPETEDITVEGSGTSGGYRRKPVDSMTLFTSKCYPIITNNEPLEGFEVAKSVKRCGWNGGNVVWRIADPRGFELEISSSNFARVLDCTTLINGVIQGKCVWGRDGKDNILLPVASDVYQTAQVLTAKTNTKISLKDINPGDTVAVLSNKIADEESVVVYLGKYFFVEATNSGNDTPYFNLAGRQVERYLLKSVASGKYYTLSTPKVVNIINKLDAPLNKLDIAKEVTGQLSRDVTVDDTSFLVLVSPTQLTASKIKFALEPLAEDESTDGDKGWPIVDRYRSDPIVAMLGDRVYLASNQSEYDHNSHGYVHTGQLIEADISQLESAGVVKFNVTSVTQSYGTGYWSRNHTRHERVIRKDYVKSDLTLHRMTVTTDTGIKGKVFRLGYY